jgi:hypothetical protein
MGVRTGITETFNNHLVSDGMHIQVMSLVYHSFHISCCQPQNELPAYGLRIASDGHVVVNETFLAMNPLRIVGTENECYDACGFTIAASMIPYAVR